MQTAKSNMSTYSRMSNADFYIAEKKAGRVRDDDTISVAENRMIDKINMQDK